MPARPFLRTQDDRDILLVWADGERIPPCRPTDGKTKGKYAQSNWISKWGERILQSCRPTLKFHSGAGLRHEADWPSLKGETMPECDICGNDAIVEAWGGPVMQTADSVGDSYGFDRPYPKNKTNRCEKHKDKPDAPFGELWRWRKLNKEQAARDGKVELQQDEVAVSACPLKSELRRMKIALEGMILVDTNTGKVAIVNKTETMRTTIPCPDGAAYEGDCCGCLNANYDPLEKNWIFRCNECGKEWGRGHIEVIYPVDLFNALRDTADLGG